MLTTEENKKFSIDDATRIMQEALDNNLNLDDAIEILLAINTADILSGQSEDSIDYYSKKSKRDTINEEIPFKKSLLVQAKNKLNDASKVVDENGEPLVVYNGGRGGNFTVFSKEKITDSNNLGKGFYFTPIKTAAENYRDSFGWDDYNDDGFIKQEVLDSLHLKAVFLNIRNMGNNNESLDTNTDIDGSYSTSGLQYVVRNPNQIKSATDNIGTFSTTNDDIRYRVVPNSSFEVLRAEEKEMILKKGWTVEKFNSISQEERDQAIKCIAF